LRKLSNHLGNVLANIGDKKIAAMSSVDYIISYFVSSYSLPISKPQTLISKFQFPNSSPAPMTERTAVVTPTDVRYGFQGQEEDDELWSGAVSFKYRVEDARLGRFFSVDPLFKDYPWYSPYHFAGNIPIRFNDIEGLEPGSSGSFEGEIRTAKATNCEEVRDKVYYWVWMMSSQSENAKDGSWVMISVRPVEIIEYVSIEPTYVPSPLWGTAAEQQYRDAGKQSDVVPNPEIASTGGASGVNGGRFGCTRYDASKSCGGVKGRKPHDGTDIYAEPGKPIFAIFGGKVVGVVDKYSPGSIGDNGYGNYIVISTELPNGMKLSIKYAHLDGVGVMKGDYVHSGENIGTAGATGNAYNVPFKHVHVGAKLDGASVDPEGFMPSTFDTEGKSTKQ
jgi:RHS repeat-associated protein